jgi:hypothetical protein
MKVYKFRPIRPPAYDWTYKLVTAGECYFAPPASLNDPLEYAATFHSEGVSRDLKIQYLITTGILPPDAFWGDPKVIDETIERFEQQMQAPSEILHQNGSQGVFCTSEMWDNAVLWAHYADQHAGVAIEIETEGEEILSRPFYVKYTDRAQKFPLYQPFHLSQLHDICSTKTMQWAAEKEIRFFCGAGVHKISPSRISAIYVGINGLSSFKLPIQRLCEDFLKTNPKGEVHYVKCNRASGNLEIE